LKTNAARILDGLGIRYELRDYEVDEEDLSAESVARKVGLPPEQVFKTLVVRGDRNGVCLAVVPAGTQLDLKALARLTGDRKVEPVTLKEVQPLTGYIRGGVTALGCKKGYPVSVEMVALREVQPLTGYIRGGVTVPGARKDYPAYADETIELFDVISVSAGARGTQILLAPADYLRAAHAKVGPIAKEG